MVGVKVGESFLQVTNQMCSHAGLDDDVIDIDLQVAADLLPKIFLHALLEGGSSVLEAEQHGSVAESAKGGDKRTWPADWRGPL